MLGVPTVRTGCQNDLNDKRERNWDDEVIDLLNNEYQDWKHPSRTYMVPCVFPCKKRELNDGEKTEKTFFDLLQAFGESRSEGMFVIHSYNFAELISEWSTKSNRREEKWLIGEHDFVVIHHQWGIIFFQVKAAERMTGKFAQAVEQINKDRKSLQAFIEENVKGRMKREIDHELLSTYPGFVVMPNCPCSDGSVVSRPNGVFKEDCENLKAFSEWWDKKVKREKVFDQKLFEYLVMRFVGMSHSIPYTLSKLIDQNKEVLEECTTEQLSLMFDSVPEQWISGPAGSGKTWLLMKKVLMLAQNTLLRGTKVKILVVCYNKPLSMMFAKVFEGELISFGDLEEVVEVKTFESLLLEITGSISGNSEQEKAEHVAQALKAVKQGSVFSQRYDHVFVDECQDFHGDAWPSFFRMLHKDDDDDDCSSGEPKHIWFLYDTNQYLNLSEEQYKLHFKSIKKGTKLTRVFRSTGSIFDQSKKYFRNLNAKPIMLGHRVRGLEITWDNSLKTGKVADVACIVKHIKKLCRDKVDAKDICILTQNVDIRDGISSELKKKGIETQNAEDLFGYNLHVNKVVVESIRRFKGLESKVVILYKPQFFQESDWPVKKVKELLYTAMSRCFCYLIVITTKPGCNALKSEEGITEQKIIHHRQKASFQSLEGLESEYISQMNSLFNDPFSKRGSEACYESGPPEHESPSKRSIEDDDNDGDPNNIKRSPAKLLRKEEADHLYKKISKNVEKRPVKVPGCDLLEPGDPNIKDSIRNNGIKLLEEPVKQNLRYPPGSSDWDEAFKGDDITSVVAWIEYKVYDQRRREINSKKYTQDCRNLKKEIETSTEGQICHESVLNALHEFRATKHS